MFINIIKYNRNTLSDLEKLFLLKIVPIARLIQKWTKNKAEFVNKLSSHGIFSSIIIANIILKSEWGRHPISQEKFDGKYSNNLLLIKSNKFWTGRTHIYQNNQYKAYKDWEEFCVDYSDWVVFSGLYDKVLDSSILEDQISFYVSAELLDLVYNTKIKNIIDYYNLREFHYE